MAASSDQKEYEIKHFGEEVIKNECDGSLENSSEESRRESHEINQKQIESHFTTETFLRTCDSEDSLCDSNHKISNVKTNSKDLNQSPKNDTRSDAKDFDKELVVVSSNSTGDSLRKTKTNKIKSESSKPRDDRKSKNYKAVRKPWGESVGITDSNGRPKRLVNLSEVNNYIPLKMRYRSDFKFYFSLIDSRYPQRFRNYGSDKQRWRMRYNVFVDGLFDSSKKFESIVHVGEIIIYFDIAKNMFHPFYTNCSFYANYIPFEKSVDTTRLTQLMFRLNAVLTSKLMLQLKFPINAKTFRHTDQLYFKFLMRQKDMMDELLYIQSKQWSSAAKWLFFEREKNDRNDAFGWLSIDNKHETRKSDDRRRRRLTNLAKDSEERDRIVANQSEEFKSSKRAEERSDRRYDFERRRRNPSNRRASGQTYVANPLRETASGFNQKWSEDRISPQKKTQRRNRNSDRMEANGGEGRPSNSFRNERRSRPKTRRD